MEVGTGSSSSPLIEFEEHASALSVAGIVNYVRSCSGSLIRFGALLGISFLSATAASAQSPIPLSYFGMHIQNDSNSWPALPIGSRRLWDSGATWSGINTGSGNSIGQRSTPSSRERPQMAPTSYSI